MTTVRLNYDGWLALPPATATIGKGAAARPGKSPLPVIPPALKARGGKRKEVPVTVQ